MQRAASCFVLALLLGPCAHNLCAEGHRKAVYDSTYYGNYGEPPVQVCEFTQSDGSIVGIQFQHGVAHGLYLRRSADGRVLEGGKFENGARSGAWVTFDADAKSGTVRHYELGEEAFREELPYVLPLGESGHAPAEIRP